MLRKSLKFNKSTLSLGAAIHQYNIRTFPIKYSTLAMSSSADTSYCSEICSSPTYARPSAQAKTIIKPEPSNTLAPGLISYIQNTQWSSTFDESQEQPQLEEVRPQSEILLKEFEMDAIFSDDVPIDGPLNASQSSPKQQVQILEPVQDEPQPAKKPISPLRLSQAQNIPPQSKLVHAITSPTSSPSSKKPKTSFVSARPFSTVTRQQAATSNSNHTILLATQNAPSDIQDQQIKGALAPKVVKPIILSKEQEHILNLAYHGTSLFYTGSAGTGKSILLKAMIKSLKKKHEPGTVAVTASTGLAACNIGGTTLHAFAGIGFGDMDVPKCIKKIKRNRSAYTKWLKTKVLIIDEVSMIDGKFMDKLNEIAKTLRNNQRPFGGIQLIVSGDFYQLPPVTKRSVQDNLNGDYSTVMEETVFAFESLAWKETIECTIILKEVFRQKGDQEFVDMLNEMRTGKVSKSNAKKFQYLQRPLASRDGIEPAELFPTRAEVDNANHQRLQTLTDKALVYQSVDTGTLPAQKRFLVLNESLATPRLFLKKNAQVMCIKNFDDTLVNGSLGQVVDFMDRNTYMAYKEMKETDKSAEEILELVLKERKGKVVDLPEDEETNGILENIPLSESVFSYIADMKGPGNDSLQDLGASTFEANKQRKLELLKQLHETSTLRKYPLVRFLLPDGFNHREVLVEPEEWTIEDESGTVLARRIQLPLILAWSLSIHKSQGQTLPKVKVDLRRIFERGQAYVALSRASSRRGLQILNFRTDKVMVHEKVNRFYMTLLTAEQIQNEEQNVKENIEFNQISAGSGATPITIENKQRPKRIDDYF